MKMILRFVHWLLDLLRPSAPRITHHVTGRVASRSSAGVGGLRVVLVDKGVGGDAELGAAETDARGHYEIAFANAGMEHAGEDKPDPDLQALVYAGETLVGASEIRYDASTEESLDIVLDDAASAALASEYESLTGALSRHHQGSLAALEETEERRDITYLAGKTGWDARAVALASLADQFSARANQGAIPPPLFYALFRAGLPANEAALYQTAPAGVERIWRQALRQSVIPATLEAGLPDAVATFQRLGAERLLDGPALVGTSPLKELLAPTLDAAQQREFAALQARHAETPGTLWDAAQEAFGEATTKRLRLDGQLAYLTLNNAPLIAALHNAAGSDGLADTAQLVADGFHRPARWREAFGREPVPPEIPGRNETEKRERYAELLAAQLRLSFPTAVAAQMVKDGETPVASAALQRGVHAFLTGNEGKFEIGMQPVAQFVARNALSVDPEVVREVSRIQRVYQITPDDTAMNGLLREGIDSAAAAMRYGREEFGRVFKDAAGGEQKALAVHDKAQQVHGAVVNIVVNFLTARNAPAIGSLSILDTAAAPAPDETAPASGEAAPAPDVRAYATLERLFGEMDYCACEHCRSVLSPAAYLVDLLLFLDRPANLDPQPVPLPPGGAGAGAPPPRPFLNPQAVLLERRPDIAHLPLTCENVNTPLPNIDLAIAAMTYYVAHTLSLAGYVGPNIDGSATPAALLASPQFVSDVADAALAGASFPPPLPFHRPLEMLRRYLGRFEAPLAEIMADLRKDDSLDRAPGADHAWRDVWMETLGLSRPEHGLLTESVKAGTAVDVMLTVRTLYGFETTTSDATLLATLRNARAFCRRVGIGYEQLADILRTNFVNPHAGLIPRLQRLGVSFATIKALKEGTITGPAFDALLAPGIDPAPYDGDIQAWLTDAANYDRIMQLLTLTNPADPEDVCDFAAVELRYSNPDAAANEPRLFEFVRLIRFIRLWKKLGWTLEQTDKALTALWPPSPTPDDPSDAVNLERLDAGFLDLLPRLGVLRRATGLLKLKPARDLLPLLACVAPIDTRGERSLYRDMFLDASPGDEAFAVDGFGRLLTDIAEPLLNHVPALRAAFELTADEFDLIAAALDFTPITPLTLDNVTDIFRRGWLARKLKLSVRELLLLARFTGEDPFGAPDPVAPGLLRMIALVGRLRALGFKPVQLLYLVWNQDLGGKSAPPEAETLAFARTVRGTLAAVEPEFALVDDPEGGIARARMALVYGTETADFFFGLLEHRVVAAVDYSHDEAALAKAITDAAPGRVGYDDFAKQLSFTGVMTAAAQSALKAVAGVSAAFQAAVDALHDENAKLVEPFFARFPELRPLHDAYEASAKPEVERRNDLFAALLPELRKRRKQQQAKQALATATAAEPGLVAALTEDPAVLHAAGDAARQALDDVAAAETMGLAAQYFFAATATGIPDLVRPSEPDLAFSAAGANKLPANATTPGAGISVRWSGYVEAPEDGLYNIRVETDSGATVTLALGDGPVALTQSGGVRHNSTPIRLRGGTLHALTLTVEDVRNDLVLRWQTTGRGWAVIPASCLYSTTSIGNLRQVYVRVMKAAALAAALKLSAGELVHLAQDADYQVAGEGWLNLLPVTGSPDGATAKALAKAVLAVADYAAIKARFAPGDDRLLDLLRAPEAATAGPESPIFLLTRWDAESLDALLARFGRTRADLAHVDVLRRICDAFAWVKKLEVPAATLAAAATNEPSAETVRDLQGALRARYDESAWLDVLKPINDEMRSLQRDALVAHILHRMRSHPALADIDTPDKLFEYFLMDVQMEPCTLTSPVRHALSSIQLFIERCFMNLEPSVLPSSLNANQWQMMKRYRLWEADRLCFLFPENWLDGGLRDDQSPIFKDVMSKLLQGDITEDRAAEALTSYLTQLEEVAKLEMCGIHYAENASGKADDVVHLVGRTAGANRKYFHRRRERGSWTPWQKIGADIEDNPVLPVVWRDRLFLFWLKVMKETTTPAAPTATSPSTPLAQLPSGPVFARPAPTLTVRAILNWSELVGDKWQPVRTSDPADPLLLGTHIPLTEQDKVRSKLTLSALYRDKALEIVASYDHGAYVWQPLGFGYISYFYGITGYVAGSSFLLHNPFSTPELRSTNEPSPKRTLDTSGFAFKVGYGGLGTPHAVVNNALNDAAVQPRHPMGGDPWDAPFLYEDSRHAFYVTTQQRLVTLPTWDRFGLFELAQVATVAIPALVPPGVSDGIRGVISPRFDPVDPAPVDPGILRPNIFEAAVGPRGTVRFGGMEIGPSGGLPRTVPSR